MGTSTPWGKADYSKQEAPGIMRYTTPGHGGYHLSATRWAELRRVLPHFRPWAGDQWLEEDCDWAAAVMVWPELFTANQCAHAVWMYESWCRREGREGQVEGYEHTDNARRLYARAEPVLQAEKETA